MTTMPDDENLPDPFYGAILTQVAWLAIFGVLGFAMLRTGRYGDFDDWKKTLALAAGVCCYGIAFLHFRKIMKLKKEWDQDKE